MLILLATFLKLHDVRQTGYSRVRQYDWRREALRREARREVWRAQLRCYLGTCGCSERETPIRKPEPALLIGGDSGRLREP